MDFKERLAKSTMDWDDAKAQADSFGDKRPDGVYEFQLQKAEVCESKSKGLLQVAVEIMVLSGEEKGQVHREYLGLEQQNRMWATLQFVAGLGYEAPERVEGLIDLFEEINDANPCFLGTLKTKGDFQNLTIQRLLEMEEDEDEDDSTDEETESEDVSDDSETETEDENPNDEHRLALLAFCASSGVKKVDDESTTEELIAELNKVEFEEAGLTEVEIEMLKAVGLEDSIDVPKLAPKPKAKVKTKTKTKKKGKK